MSYDEHAMIRTMAIGCAVVVSAACLAQNQQYRAKLALENGAALPASPLFVAPPPGDDLPRCVDVEAFANGVITYVVPLIEDPGSDPMTRHFDDKCEITILLKGYRKATVTLHDGAVILLRQIGDPQGSTVSMTALHVPKDAAKAHDKGIAAMGDGKLAAAQKQFERAVELYPDYAQAWSDLGEVLEQQSKPKEAVAACEQALKAEPKYIRPYLQMIRIAVSEKRMEDAAALGDRALQLNPVEFPGVYYYDAEANYALKHLDVAEKAARQVIDIDKGREFPAAEALLGKVLADEGDVRGALDHFSKYLLLAPKADDVPAVRQRMAELDRSRQQAK
jgi:tetratricopeptide (TPR) repeat protein